jgi:hypothetical protein
MSLLRRDDVVGNFKEMREYEYTNQSAIRGGDTASHEG